jgi:subtilisin family serine protease
MRNMGTIVSAILVSVLLTSTTSAKSKAPRLGYRPPVDVGQDPKADKMWHLSAIGVPQAWKTTHGDNEIIIAVVDSGVDYRNPDLRPALWENALEDANNKIDDDNNGFIDDLIGWNFNEENQLPWDDNGHGTFIAGLISAQKNNNIGGIGVCPDCRLMAMRFLDSEGFGDDEDSNRAIKYAIDNGASIINLSYAGEGYDKDLHDLLKYALEKDVLVVVAAGNDGEKNDGADIFPANHRMPNMLTVGASTAENTWRKASNYSSSLVHLAAPGQKVWGPWNDMKWYSGSGTSFSAPIAAGVAGLVRSANPALTAPQVRDILIKTVRKVSGFESKCAAGGIIDAAAAVACALDLACL